jgi:hypothetical protein
VWRNPLGWSEILTIEGTIERLAYTGLGAYLVAQSGGSLVSVDRGTGASRAIGPELAETRLLAVGDELAGVVLVGVNARDQRYFDLWRADVRTGQMQPVQEHSGVVGEWFIDGVAFDGSFRARLLIGRDSMGQRVLLHAGFDGDSDSPIRPVGTETRGAMSWHAFREDSGLVYLVERIGSRDVLRVVDLRDDSESILFEVDGATIDDVQMRAGNAGVQAIRIVFDDGSAIWSVRDVSIEQDLATIRRAIVAPFRVVDRSVDGQVWLLRWEDERGERLSVFDARTRLVQDLMFDPKPPGGTETPPPSAPDER